MNVHVVLFCKELQYALRADLSCRGYVGGGPDVWLIDGGLLRLPPLRRTVLEHRGRCAAVSCAEDYYRPEADKLGIPHILLPDEWDRLLYWLALAAGKEAAR